MFQENLQEVKTEVGTNEHDEHAVFEHEHTYDEEKTEAVSQIVAEVDHGHRRATLFANFIKTEGQNAIVVGEILGKPKGWE